jgi:purine-binding chemotaxis protein CheW
MISFSNILADQIVVFTLDKLFYAFSLQSVIRVIHSVEVKYLPDAPEVIKGIVIIKGQIIPVADIRKRLGLPARVMDINDQIIIADTGKRKIAFPVDNVTGIRYLTPQQRLAKCDNAAFGKKLSGVVEINNDLILICDLERFLNLDDEKELEQSLKIGINES